MDAIVASTARSRRIIAVFIDTIVFFAIWTVIGLAFSQGSLFYTVAVFFVIDVVLTAFLGVSLGRLVTGIRVVRETGATPGIVPALIRTVLVFVSGWAGLLLYWWAGRVGFGARMWWDAAAKTRIVLAGARSAPPPSPVGPMG